MRKSILGLFGVGVLIYIGVTASPATSSLGPAVAEPDSLFDAIQAAIRAEVEPIESNRDSVVITKEFAPELLGDLDWDLLIQPFSSRKVEETLASVRLCGPEQPPEKRCWLEDGVNVVVAIRGVELEQVELRQTDTLLTATVKVLLWHRDKHATRPSSSSSWATVDLAQGYNGVWRVTGRREVGKS